MAEPETSRAPSTSAQGDLVLRRDVGRIAVILLNGRDGNRLTLALVEALSSVFTDCLSDKAIYAIVLGSASHDFCAGPSLDLASPSPDDSPPPPSIAATSRLAGTIATSKKPVVAALCGRVSSGGVSLALAASARIAEPQASFHWPEPGLGLLPPANGAPRLARLIGADLALRCLMRQTSVSASEAADFGLAELCSANDLLDIAVERAQMLVATKPEEAAPGLRDHVSYRHAIRAAWAALPSPLPPHKRSQALLIESLEAAQLLPEDQAMRFDQMRAEDAAASSVARALTHLARATRRALVTPKDTATVASLAGPILLSGGSDIAQIFALPMLRAGIDVILADPDRNALGATLEEIAEALAALVAKGTLSQAQSDAAWAKLGATTTPDTDTPVQVAVATAANLAWLRQAAQNAWPVVPVIVAAHDSDADREPVAMVFGHGEHPRLCEIVVRDGADPSLVSQVKTLILRASMTPLLCKERASAPALRAALARAVARLRSLGVSERSLTETGLVRLSHAPEQSGETQEPHLPLGVDRMLLLAVVNEGARLLEQGVSARPSDLDLAMVLGAGWPKWRGGPMAEADRIGPLVSRHELRQIAAFDPTLWTPEPMIDEMIRNGWCFADLNAD